MIVIGNLPCEHSRVDGQRDPELVLPGGKLEARRHHADDFVRIAAEIDGAPDDGRVPAEPTLPQPVTDQHDGTPSALLVLGSEGPSKNRTDSKHRKEVG